MRYEFDLDKLECPNGMIPVREEDGFTAVVVPTEEGHQKMLAYGRDEDDGFSWVHKDYQKKTRK